MSTHPLPSMPPHPICLCPYFTSTPIYATHLVTHNTNITSFSFLHIPLSRLPYSIFPNLITPEARPYSSRRVIEHRSIRMNQLSNLMKKIRIHARRIKEGGGGIAKKYQDLIDM